MLGTNDVIFTPDMGGKEGLSALGYSRTYRSAAKEHWAKEDVRSYGTYRYKIEFSKAVGGGWWCGPQIIYADSSTRFNETQPMALSLNEMQACVTRMRELESEVDE